MPTTPISVLLYVFLLTPGILFLMRAESHRPRTSRSAFRETALVVVLSSLCAGIVLTIMILVSIPFPPLAEGFTSFVQDPVDTLADHPRQVLLWMGVFLVATGALGYLAGSERTYAIFDALVPKNGKNLQGSAWQATISEGDNEHNEVIVGIQLKSGIWLQGVYAHHTHTDDDSGDRALVLQSPLGYRGVGESEVVTFDNFDRLVVQASEMDYLLSYPRARA